MNFEICEEYAPGQFGKRATVSLEALKTLQIPSDKSFHYSTVGLDKDGNKIVPALIFDIDYPTVQESRKKALLLVKHLKKYLDLEIFVVYTGGRGYHVYVPAAYFGVSLPEEAKTIIHKIASIVGINVDLAIYNDRHLIRMPGTKNLKTGNQSKVLTTDELEFKKEIK